MTMIIASRPASRSRNTFLAGLGRVLSVWSQRQKLKSLDDRALNDMGITRRQALEEARRPIWDAPQTWRC